MVLKCLQGPHPPYQNVVIQDATPLRTLYNASKKKLYYKVPKKNLDHILDL